MINYLTGIYFGTVALLFLTSVWLIYEVCVVHFQLLQIVTGYAKKDLR